MIRRATVADLDEIVELGATFLAYSPHRDIPLDREAFAAFAEQMIEGLGAIFLSDDGMLGGVLTPLYFNPAVKAATELFWWAPKEGRALRIAFEDWAKAEGAEMVQFTGLVDNRAEASGWLFRRAGYRPVETGYVKRL